MPNCGEETEAPWWPDSPASLSCCSQPCTSFSDTWRAPATLFISVSSTAVTAPAIQQCTKHTEEAVFCLLGKNHTQISTLSYFLHNVQHEGGCVSGTAVSMSRSGTCDNYFCVNSCFLAQSDRVNVSKPNERFL